MRSLPLFLLSLFFLWPVVAQESPPSPADRYPAIMNLIQQKDFSAAMAIVAPLRKQFPENAEVHLFEAAISEGSGEFARCEDLAEEYIQKYPTSVNLDQAYYLLGSAQVKGGTREQGFESLRKAADMTDDPTLQSQIERMIGSILQSSNRIGIQLGGQPPITEEEKKKLSQISFRILQRALRDFKEIHQEYPVSLDQLLEGDPPILLSLPRNPFALDGQFEYRKDESGFDLTEPVGK